MQNKISIMKFILGATLSSSLLMVSGPTFAKEYYKWVDSKGSTHYTATPPPKNAKKTAKVDTYGYRGSSTVVTTPASNSTSTPVPVTSTAPQQQNQQPTSSIPNGNTQDKESQIVQPEKETVRPVELPS